MDAKQVFDRAAADYDGIRRKIVPAFDDFYGTALGLIPFEREDEFRVLDLGAGTGLVSALVAEAFSNATLTLVDISSEMLSKARARFAEHANVSFQVVDLEHAPPAGRFDVAISALALHHIDPANLEATFRNVYNTLDSGGIFINADQTLGTSAENERQYAQHWRDEVMAQGCTEADVQAALERMQADKTATLEAQLAAMRGAGFEQVDCWYKHYRMAVYSGRKV